MEKAIFDFILLVSAFLLSCYVCYDKGKRMAELQYKRRNVDKIKKVNFIDAD